MTPALADAREILVRGPNWLGDLVMATPGLRALRAACPRATVTLWVRAGLEDLLAGSPDVDRVIALPRTGRSARGLWSAGRAARRPGGYDLGICLPDSFSSALLMRIAGARNIVGHRRDGRRALLDVAVPRPPGEGAGGFVARERHVLGLLASIGIEHDDTTTSLATTAEEESTARALLARLGLDPDRDPARTPWVGLAPGASYGPSKCWPIDRFASLGDALAAEGAQVLVLGSPDEVERCRAVVSAMQAPAFDLSGRMGVGPFKSVARRLSLLVTNDAGARHVAVAFGVPCVVLFGPTSVAKTPLGLENVTVVERQDACRPCYQRVCPIDHRCLAGIAADQVIPLARARLAAGLAARPIRGAGLDAGVGVAP